MPNISKKKVLFFVKSFPVLSQTFVINQINDLLDEGHDVNILAITKGDMELNSMPNIARHNLLSRTSFLVNDDNRYNNGQKKIKLVLSSIANCLFAPRKWSLLTLGARLVVKRKLSLATNVFHVAAHDYQTIQADTVIAHFGNMGVLANHLMQSKIIVGRLLTVFHGYEISEFEELAFWSGYYKKLGDAPGLLLPISNLWAKRLNELGIANDKIRVLHMGVNVTRFKFEDRPLSNPIRILSVARATEKKGLTYALEAIEQCNIDVRYDIIGGGELEKQLIAQMTNYKSREKITIHGPKPSEFVAEALTKTDIFLLPSVTDKHGDMEGIPVSLMEAMASGVIALSTVHSGIPELIEDKQTGFLVPERNATAIANAIEFIAHQQDLSVIKLSALKHVTEQFNAKILTKDLSELI
ncbi:glycosyltransferase [Paraglaciecola sp. 20A4]|uniref:glycosyltransferase n=1 Tax=Paraglaciecola sp. 20A4 TaxID=2687288 RepID=UPI00140D0098|nr:glycosyltransferase [Paraglaciecola sp. 20A4]